MKKLPTIKIIAMAPGTKMPPPKRGAQNEAGLRAGISELSSMKFLLERLFGKPVWYNLKETGDIRPWRKETTRLLRAIDLSIRSTVPGDSQAFTLGSGGGTHITNVVVDGSSVGALTSYLFDNVSADHSISVFAMGNPGGGMLYCSGPMAPGWNVSLPDGGCPKPVAHVYFPSFTVIEKVGSYTLRAGQLIQ